MAMSRPVVSRPGDLPAVSGPAQGTVYIHALGANIQRIHRLMKQDADVGELLHQ